MADYGIQQMNPGGPQAPQPPQGPWGQPWGRPGGDQGGMQNGWGHRPWGAPQSPMQAPQAFPAVQAAMQAPMPQQPQQFQPNGQPGGFNPFSGFMRQPQAPMPQPPAPEPAPPPQADSFTGGYGPRFDDLAQRTQSAVQSSLGLFGASAPFRGSVSPVPQTPPQILGAPNFPTQPAPMDPAFLQNLAMAKAVGQPAPAVAPVAPAPAPAPVARPPLQLAAPPQMPQQFGGQQIAPVAPPMAGAVPYARGGRVSSLACRC